MIQDASFDKLLIPGEFLLKILLWMIDMKPEMLEESIRFIAALILSLVVWVWLIRIGMELLKKALGIGPYYGGG